jgi:shikimate dehydrogenase
MKPPLSGQTLVAGVAGRPVRHSLSPAIHNAWLAAAGLDGVYVAFGPTAEGFTAFACGLRGGVIRGLNVTAPFKEEALALADSRSERARRAGSANLLVFGEDGVIAADNTDGVGLLGALEAQASGFDPAAGVVMILGAGGAARGAAAAFLDAGAPGVVFVNRSLARAEALAALFGPRARACRPDAAADLAGEAGALINATPLGLHGGPAPDAPLDRLAPGCVVMDMVYRPLRTGLLEAAAARGLATVDGLEMLIGQAAPSYQAFYGAPPPSIDVRSLVLSLMETQA